jgi:phosphate transport system substrate-binding protein
MHTFRLNSLVVVSLLLFFSGLQAQPNDNTIYIDGSSTVYPLTNAVINLYKRSETAVPISIEVSGTGGGLKRFIKGETHINNSSRKITENEHYELQKNGVNWYEIALAQDAIAIIINKTNSFVKDLTIEELRLIWSKNSVITTWNDLRATWPKEDIKLYGPGLESGTRDYFAEVLFGNSNLMRSDYEMSEDDDELEKDVENDRNALSFFGIAYVARNNNQVKLAGIRTDDAVIFPTYSAIQARTYPLSRTLYLHINRQKLEENTAVKDFLRLYVKSVTVLAKAAGYIPLDARIYLKSLHDLNIKTQIVSK